MQNKTGRTMDRSAQVIDQSLPLSNLTSVALILQGLKARSKEGERVGESMLGSSFLRWGIGRMA
jgi:hypothetical protein